MVRSLRTTGAHVSLDTQFDVSEQWTGAEGHLRQLLPLLDVLLFNEVEAAGIAQACAVPSAPPSATAAAVFAGTCVRLP